MKYLTTLCLVVLSFITLSGQDTNSLLNKVNSWSKMHPVEKVYLHSDRNIYSPGDTVWVEIYYQREMHWNREMAKATVVDKPFWFPPRRGATPPGPY